MRLSASLLALVAFATLSVSAHADTYTLTESGMVSGSDNIFGYATVPFNDVAFTITANYSSSATGVGFEYIHLTAPLTYSIAGLGTFTSYDPDIVSLNTYGGEVGVGTFLYPDDSLDASFPGLVNVPLQDGFGPLTGTGTVYNTPTDITTGGFLTFSSLDGPVTITVTATPEPSSLLLLSTGVLGLAGAARRRLSRR